MEGVGVVLTIAGLFLLIVALATEEGLFAFFGVIFCAFGILMLLHGDDTVTIPDDTVTIQEIEYAINKCSSFGGLKEFRSDVIICLDKTEIKMNFEPEKKVEAE